MFRVGNLRVRMPGLGVKDAGLRVWCGQVLGLGVWGLGLECTFRYDDMPREFFEAQGNSK